MKKEVLGTGSFGIVFRGSYRDEEVAVKRLELHRLDPDGREVKLQIDLEHDNVLKILSVDEDEDFKYSNFHYFKSLLFYYKSIPHFGND
jgi:serine/threonine protein kinase